MSSFSELVKHKAEERQLSIAALRDMLGWSYHQSRSIVIGTLSPKKISFQEAAELASILEVDIRDLANAAELNAGGCSE